MTEHEKQIRELRERIRAAKVAGVDATDLWRRLDELTRSRETRPLAAGERRV